MSIKIIWYLLEENEYETVYISRRFFNFYFKINFDKNSEIFSVYYYDNNNHHICDVKNLEDAKIEAQNFFDQKIKEYYKLL